ncbi:M48 family metalloprotease [Sphingomicrobium lutaoense]|uniref:Putative Zn-dependent protease n=1 Tax=Sphingomicrobium lutaoense TaxID=515949 RepID=A0A839YZV1_9SPHN|nr:M48 family metalloprotease [Sphingomicrobium lutaoense]MBB3763307.1 putative Zn-dependent protease [Sphingomicrobium lutaoense]
MTPTADPAISPQEAQKANDQHQAVVAEFGGEVGGSRGSYVERVGDSVAVYSGTPGAASAYDFTILNSAVENAFAVPGGRIYITRQLMGLMDNEAELAFVLGHEVGHIAADHAQLRQSRAQRNTILGVLGAVIGGVVGGDSGLGNLLSRGAMQYSQLNTLSYSRDQEYESDSLGLGYMTQAGYDPRGGAGMLAALGRASALEARIQGRDNRTTPEWARTHPLSENRVARAAQIARDMPNAGTRVNRDTFLGQVDGMIFDDDPAQGVIEGRNFIHPDLRLRFTVPSGFTMQNSTRQVGIQGSGGQAIFTMRGYNGNLDSYVVAAMRDVLGQQAQQVNIPSPRSTRVNGLPAAYTTTRVNTQNGAVDLSVFAYQFSNDRAYHFAMITQAGAGIGPFQSMVGSVQRLSAQEAANVRPRVIDVVTVQRGDTVQSLARRMAYNNFQVERFLSLNGLASNASLQAGQKVKLVVYGRR